MDKEKEKAIKQGLLRIMQNSFFGNYNPYSPTETMKIRQKYGDKFAVDWACSGQTEREGTK